MFPPTERPPRQSLDEGPSTVFWVAVVACTVVINASVMVNLSCKTLASGARQLVVHEALEIWKVCHKFPVNTDHLVTRSRRNTYDFVLWIVSIEVDAEYEHWCICRGSGNDDLLSSTRQVSRGSVRNINVNQSRIAMTIDILLSGSEDTLSTIFELAVTLFFWQKVIANLQWTQRCTRHRQRTMESPKDPSG